MQSWPHYNNYMQRPKNHPTKNDLFLTYIDKVSQAVMSCKLGIYIIMQMT